MISIRKVSYWLFITLSFTNLSFFRVGMAEFTLFYALSFLVLGAVIVDGIYRKTLKVYIPKFFLVSLIYVCIVNVVYLSQIKSSSFVYSVFLMVEVWLLYNLVPRLTRDDVARIFKIIVVIYFVNLAVATIFIRAGYYPQHGLIAKIFKIYIFDGRIRPYAFSDEPSYAAIILVFAFYVLLFLDNFRFQPSRLIWYLVLIASIVMTGSAYGFLLLGLLLLYFLFKSKIISDLAGRARKGRGFNRFDKVWIGMILIGAALVVVLNTDFENNRSARRLVRLYTEIAKSDESIISSIKKTAYVDGSASFRLVPTIRLLENYQYEPWSAILFGKGAGQSIPFFSSFYKGFTIVLGFIPAFVYNYGIVGAVLFLVFFLKLLPRKKFIFLVLFFPFLLNADFNTQAFLFVLFCGMCARHVENIESDLKTSGTPDTNIG